MDGERWVTYSVAIILYYWIVRRWVGLFVAWCRVFNIGGLPQWEFDTVAMVALAGISQLIFVFVLWTLSRGSLALDAFEPRDAALIGSAICLGVGQFGAGGHISRQLDKVKRSITKDESDDPRRFLTSGWMGQFTALAKINTALVLALSLIYITGEELLFRGLLLGRDSSIYEISYATFLFCAIQIAGLKDKRTWIYPIVGAIVVGLSNGAVYTLGGGLVACVVSHWSFFCCGLIAWASMRR